MLYVSVVGGHKETIPSAAKAELDHGFAFLWRPVGSGARSALVKFDGI